MSENQKINAAFFRYIYSSLDTPLPENIAERISDDFFLNCNCKKTDDLFYIVDFVIPSFFKYYFDIKTDVIVKDDCYLIIFDEELNLFAPVVNGIVKYLYEGVRIEVCKNDDKPTWKITKE